jgi:DNA polymerase III epsilon subunit-like protein
MNDIMLDLETMGNGQDAAIVAIGAVAFDADRLGESFYVAIDLQSSVAEGGVMDASTVIWWLQQSDIARTEITAPAHQFTLLTALSMFTEFANDHGKDVRIWGNGAAFDNVILRRAYQRAGIEAPWRYSRDRCYRTVAGMCPDIKIDRTGGTHHNALDDAIAQARHLIAINQATGANLNPKERLMQGCTPPTIQNTKGTT